MLACFVPGRCVESVHDISREWKSEEERASTTPHLQMCRGSARRGQEPQGHADPPIQNSASYWPPPRSLCPPAPTAWAVLKTHRFVGQKRGESSGGASACAESGAICCEIRAVQRRGGAVRLCGRVVNWCGYCVRGQTLPQFPNPSVKRFLLSWLTAGGFQAWVPTSESDSTRTWRNTHIVHGVSWSWTF